MKKILVVEDNELLRNVLVDRLKKEGYEVLEATNGQEGLTSATSNHPDFIVLDIIMPVMDGITMLKSLREDRWGKDVPIIVITNMNDTQNISEAMKYKVARYMVKDGDDPEMIIDAVHTILKDKAK